MHSVIFVLQANPYLAKLTLYMNLCWILCFNMNSIMSSALTLLITLGLDTDETVYDCCTIYLILGSIIGGENL